MDMNSKTEWDCLFTKENSTMNGIHKLLYNKYLVLT